MLPKIKRLIYTTLVVVFTDIVVIYIFYEEKPYI